MGRGTNLPAVGGFNQAVVLDVIRRHREGLSRVEIAELTGLAPQTVSNVCRRLLDDGLVREAGTRVSGPGKPRTILELVPTSRYAVGVHVDPAVVTYVLLDLRGDVVIRCDASTPSASSPAAIVAGIVAVVEGLIEQAGIDAAAVLGIGIASPGPIDLRRGIVVDPPLLEGWRSVPLRDAVATATGMPVTLEKDVTAAVVAEQWKGRRSVAPDMAFFYLGTGIGIGLASGGEVIRGAHGNAGGGGSLTVPLAHLPEHRRSEMLGHLATPQYLVDQAADLGLFDDRPDLRDLAAVEAAFTSVLAAADAGDERAILILDRAAGAIAAVLTGVVNLLDITEVVFGGPAWTRLAAHLLPRIDALVNGDPERTNGGDVLHRTTAIGDDVAAVGAAALVLDGELAPRPSRLLIAS